MTEETRVARRPGRRAPEIRCRTGRAAVPSAFAAWAPAESPGLTIEVTRVGGTAVAAVAGEIDLHTADALRARLVDLYAAGFRRLVVDFAAVPFCDAAGLGALVSAHNRIAPSGGEIALARVRPAQLRLLRITGLNRLFALHTDIGGALSAEGSPTTAR
ncbi:STAS domain-containing protein [Actinomadura graeca]|uniref:Anti-sigma factor antagonist n=2 Tax=Actinomadura graeca TaxID=2750812 RepID=A0ABX8R8J7_9ACTN|nr:STAS domain-containing protein [Actinomadura graeca]